MKLLIAFYISLACFYGLLFATLALVSLQHGMVQNAVSNLFWGVCGVSFGLLVARLLSHYSKRKRV
jgi:uncharacterized protein YacL